MPALHLFNEEDDPSLKSFCVYGNLEQALDAVRVERGFDVLKRSRVEGFGGAGGTTRYVSAGKIVAVGLKAHERLADATRSSLIYLDPQACRAVDDADLHQLVGCAGRGRAESNLVLLGPRAARLRPFLPGSRTRHHGLPPLDLRARGERPDGEAPRLTIINHLANDQLARYIAYRFLDGSDFLVECIGTAFDKHNRVRSLGDAEVGDALSVVHIHVGVQARDTERLRICDSWQSRIPVLFFDRSDAARETARPEEVRDEHDVLVCRTYDDVRHFLALLLDTPHLHRFMTANGRAAAAPAARAWGAIAQELAA